MIRAGVLSSASAAAILLSAIALSTSAQDSSTQPRMDMRKAAIELPIKRLISIDSKGLAVSVAKPPAKTADFKNPKVKPGLVNWRPNFVAACEESRRSGKPVLLFHMMGNLDDGFC